jgi:hypothetical protein
MTRDDRGASSFDELAVGLSSGSISRGKALRLMGAALVGGTLGSLGGVAAADEECKPVNKKCRKDKQCCSGKCGEDHKCAAACGLGGAPCSSGTDCCTGVCRGNGTCELCPVGFSLVRPGICAKTCASASDCTNCGPNAGCSEGFCISGTRAGSSCVFDLDCLPGEFCAESVCATPCQACAAPCQG